MMRRSLLDLYQQIVDHQEKGDEKSSKYGLWPSTIAMPSNPTLILGIDYNILAALKIMLMFA